MADVGEGGVIQKRLSDTITEEALKIDLMSLPPCGSIPTLKRELIRIHNIKITHPRICKVAYFSKLFPLTKHIRDFYRCPKLICFTTLQLPYGKNTSE